MIEGWRKKADTIIADVCYKAYLDANMKKDGTKYKTHRSYSVPEIATALIQALNKDDEYEVKRLFIVYETGALSLI